MLESQPQKILKQDPAVAGFVWVLPAGWVFGPVFEGFFEVKLDAVDQLAFGAFDHHLVFAEVGCGKQLKAFGHADDLDAVVLPDAEDVVLAGVVLPDARHLVVDVLKDGVGFVGDLDESVLVLDDAVAPLFG
jgi:hypothetical protein